MSINLKQLNTAPNLHIFAALSNAAFGGFVPPIFFTATLSMENPKGEKVRRNSMIDRLSRRNSVIQDLNKQFNQWKKTQEKINGEDGRPELVSFQYQKQTTNQRVHGFVKFVINHQYFEGLIMLTIFANAVTLGLETYATINRLYGGLLGTIDTFFITIYTFEFVLKLYADRREYFQSNYNKFDCLVLGLSYFSILQSILEITELFDVTFFRVFRALRALRALRSISFIRPLQVIVNALLKTIGSITNLLFLLLVIMYVFANIGYYLFGYGGVDRDFGTLGNAMWSLMCYVTINNWGDIQDRLESKGFSSWTRWYTVIFIFVGHYIFTNLFIGVVLQNLQEAQEEERTIQEIKKSALFKRKKMFIVAKQEQDLAAILASNSGRDVNAILEVLGELKKTLRHEELVPLEYVSCNLTWLETYLATLRYQDTTMFRAQMLHFDVANSLADIVERRLQSTSTFKT